ncbi:MAG: flagellar hook-length control protein FliK [Bacteriovoracaceae bacterium]|nr:flagellar hook-length control protein FliK [Bacteriovoracaceae bacterium]
MMTPIKNLEPQITAAKSAGKSAPQGANKLMGDAPAETGDFASMFMDQVAASEEAVVDPNALATETAAPADLMASALNPTKIDVQPSPVTMEQLNWAVEQEGIPAATEPTPKLIDPKFIQQVNEVVIPNGGEQVDAAPMQLKDLLLQQQQPAVGRSPAIDFAQAEVDPQLMQFEDFVAQKNAVTGKAIAPQAYGMPAKANSMNETLMGAKAVNAKDAQWAFEAVPNFQTGATEAQLNQPMYTIEAPMQNGHSAPSTGKVFDLQNMSKVDTTNLDQVISQVTDYIVQAKASSEPTVQMRVNHQDLGMLDITVNRTGNDVMSIAIGAQDHGTKMFLGQHREQLLSQLSQAGVNVGDLRMEQSSNSSSNKDMNHSGQQGFQGHDRQFGSESNQRRHDQQRRQDLWELLREKEVA